MRAICTSGGSTTCSGKGGGARPRHVPAGARTLPRAGRGANGPARRVPGRRCPDRAVPDSLATIRASPSSVSSGASARASGTRPGSFWRNGPPRPRRWAARRMGRPARRSRPRRDAGRGVRHLLRLRREPLPDRDGDDIAFAELEWIAGYCAFRFGRFETALGHFKRSATPSSARSPMGRAGYWLGRAHEALGNEAEAAEAYALGAQYQSSFYGQLAQERGGLPVDPAFLAEEDFGDWRARSSPPPRSSTPHFFYTKRGTRPLRTVPHAPDRKPVAGGGRDAR
jgi:hypothetical protein